MKKRFRLLAILSAAVILTGGCGTPLYEMTDDEENLVVQYAAYALAKYNIYQKDGMTNAELTEETQEEQQSTQEEEQQTDPEGTKNSAAAEDLQENALEEISLEESVGQDADVSISYGGYEICENYQEGDYFSLNPDSGNVFVIMNFTVKNTGDKAVTLETAALDNVYYASIDGGGTIKETISFGVQSLSSYDGEIEAGKSKKAVLIFQIPKEQAADVTSVELMVQMDNTTFSVKL